MVEISSCSNLLILGWFAAGSWSGEGLSRMSTTLGVGIWRTDGAVGPPIPGLVGRRAWHRS